MAATLPEVSCKQRSNSPLGSSKYWLPSIPGAGCYSNSESDIPDFYKGHHIFIPYCTGDWHSGRVTNGSREESWGFYFDGHLNVQHILDVLISKYHLHQKAKHILIAGQSAGGIGTLMNCDFIADYVQSKGHSISVKCAPNSGWFFPGNTSDQRSAPMLPPNDYPHYIEGNNSVPGGWGHDGTVPALWESYLHPDCVEKVKYEEPLAPWHCFNVHTLYPFIKTPVFIMQNQFDSDEITVEMEMPNEVNDNTKRYVSYFGDSMQNSILNYMLSAENEKKGNGAFLASCYEHVSGLNIGIKGATTEVMGHYSSDVVGDWFWGRNELPHVVYDDNTCELPCNPDCHGFGDK